MARSHIIVSVMLCAIAPVALTGQAPPELAQAVQARHQAIDQHNVTAWLRLTAPEFAIIDDAGQLSTRIERLFELRKASLGPNAPAYYVNGIRLSDDETAVSSSTPCVEDRTILLADGDVAVRRCLNDGNWRTEVWAVSDSEWQAVTVQGAPLRN